MHGDWSGVAPMLMTMLMTHIQWYHSIARKMNNDSSFLALRDSWRDTGPVRKTEVIINDFTVTVVLIQF